MGNTEFTLREWAYEDAPSIANYANNKAIADNLRNGFPYPYTEEDARQYIRSCLSGNPHKQLLRAICVDSRAVGSIGAFFQDDVYEKSVEIGYWLGEPFWGRGIMSAAIQKVCQMVFHSSDAVRIFAEPFTGNIGSRRVLEKAGFALEGTLKKSVWKNGVFSDSCIYALVR
ncbi:GNAT family N-acetyltransferase [Christensenellaceae bacterium OttesenSCG-928-K19]|nr:GNAT family N-acetyltransferase [Christensenellaceae bacterium OttesenSCG-928-K19]